MKIREEEAIIMKDDKQNDWLAQEMREENFHGCREHKGIHAEQRAGNRGWAARIAKREGYRDCERHNGQHSQSALFKKETEQASPEDKRRITEQNNTHDPAQTVKTLMYLVVGILFLIGVLSSFFP